MPGLIVQPWIPENKVYVLRSSGFPGVRHPDDPERVMVVNTVTWNLMPAAVCERVQELIVQEMVEEGQREIETYLASL